MSVMKKKWVLFFCVLVALLLTAATIQFHLGGLFINIGYRLQDHLTHDYEETPMSNQRLIELVLKKNNLAASVRSIFPRSAKHPKVALLTCMDARIDTVELMGDTRRYYYTIRTAGSVLEPLQQEMFELSINNGVQVIFLTTHTDCAAEKLAASQSHFATYPHLVTGVQQRATRIKEFLNRKIVRNKILKEELAIVEAFIDTQTGEIKVEKIYDSKSIM